MQDKDHADFFEALTSDSANKLQFLNSYLRVVRKLFRCQAEAACFNQIANHW